MKQSLHIYIMSNATGGEFVHLHRIAQIMDCKIDFFWDEFKNKPNIGIERFPWYCIGLFKIAEKVDDILRSVRGRFDIKFDIAIQRILFTRILLSKFRLPEDSSANFVSTGLMPLPRSRKMIAYVLTPPREITMSYGEILHSLKMPFLIKHIMPPLYRMLYWRLFKKSLMKSSIVVTNSLTVQSRLKKYFGIDSKVLYPSINPQEFFNRGFNKYFLHVSRFNSTKRQEYAIAAFEKFLIKRKDFVLVLAGACANTQDAKLYVNQLRQKVDEKGLPVQFIVNPGREKLVDLYANAYTCLFTAENEDFGLVPLEAMASGKPIISVNEGGPTETIIDNENGFLVNNIDHMSNQMLYLADNPSIVEEIGLRGVRRVKENFSDQFFLKQLEELISCLNNS